VIGRRIAVVDRSKIFSVRAPVGYLIGLDDIFGVEEEYCKGLIVLRKTKQTHTIS
jgi:hypothetical protein